MEGRHRWREALPFLTPTIMKRIRMIIDRLFRGGMGMYEIAYSEGYQDAMDRCNQTHLKENYL